MKVKQGSIFLFYLIPVLAAAALGMGMFFWGWVLGSGAVFSNIPVLPLSLAVFSVIIVAVIIIFLARNSAVIGSSREAVVRSLEESEEKYRSYMEASPEGFFLVTPEGFIEADSKLLKILGYSQHEMSELDLTDIAELEEESAEIIRNVSSKKGSFPSQIEGWLITKKKERLPALFTISTIYFEGEGSETVVIVKDLRTEKKVPSLQLHRDKDKLIAELQSAQFFLRQPVKELAEPFLPCPYNASIKQAAGMMTEHKKNVIFITGPAGEVMGILTDQDIRERLVAEERNPSSPVSSIMSAPVIAIPETALFHEAAFLMQDNHVRQLGIRDHEGTIRALLTDKTLLARSSRTSGPFLEEIKQSESIEQLKRSYQRLPAIIQSMVRIGAHSRNITEIVSRAGNIIILKVIENALDEIGPAPAAFGFLTLGSEGREEETLLTDQDNAIVYEDVPGADAQSIQEYFVKLGTVICTALDEIGYSFCKGGIMAMNPQWCKSVSEWKKCFSEWLDLPDGEHLLDINIFFDLRCAYGEERLAEELKDHIQTRLKKPGSFYFFMSMAVVEFKPPLGLFGRIKVDYTDEDDEVFNIKKALAPIIIYTRMLSLKHGVRVSNTLKRLERLYEKEVLSEESFRKLENAYNYLMTLRFRDQIETLELNEPLDNLIFVEELMDFEIAMLKKIFTHIAAIQSTLRIEYSGAIR